MQDFAELIERHQDMVFRTLARMTGERDVEDLAHEVFLRVFRALGTFRGEARLTTFMYRVIVNVVNDEWRRRERARLSVPAEECSLRSREPEPDEFLDRQRMADAVEESMGRLSVPERAVLVLFYQEERAYEDIAAILDLPMGTVKTHLHRARQRLKTAVQEKMRLCRTAT